MYIYISIRAYIDREREKKRNFSLSLSLSFFTYICIYIYIHIHIYIYQVLMGLWCMKVYSEWRYIPSVFMVYESTSRVSVHSGVHGVYTHTHTHTHTIDLGFLAYGCASSKYYDFWIWHCAAFTLYSFCYALTLSPKILASWTQAHEFSPLEQSWVNEKQI